MGDAGSFVGGVIALAILALLLFFELGREQAVFVYVISALIIIVAGTMLISSRGTIARLIRALLGGVSSIKIPSREEAPKGNATEKGRKIEKFFRASPREVKKPVDVKNPLLKKAMAEVRGRGVKRARFSGFARALKDIRIPRPGAGKIKKHEKEELEEMPEPKKASKRPRLSIPKIPRPKLPIEKTEPEKPPEEGERACEICGKPEGVEIHYIVPLSRGGMNEEGNMILLCSAHKEQAEKGLYSEHLLRELKGG